MASVGRILLNVFLIIFAFHGKNSNAVQAVACGGYILGNSGSFTSPNYPRQYPNNAECRWYINVGNNQKIRLDFSVIQFEVTPGCTSDYIQIYDGRSENSDLIATTCTPSNNFFISSSNSMTVYFRSDNVRSLRGFSANYHRLSSFFSGATCGGILVHKSGSFASPNYPNKYPENAQCIWYIRVERSQIVRVDITDLDLVTAPSCETDRVELYDGHSTNSPLIGKTCSEPGSTFKSSSNSMTVRFITGFDGSRRGFSAKYTSQPSKGACGGYLLKDSGSFASPNYPKQYPNSVQCTWYIRVNLNEVIKLDFIVLQVQFTTLCKSDYVAIYDGCTTDSPLKAKVCTGSERSFVSSSNCMTVHFRSDYIGTRGGFTANYYSMPEPTEIYTTITSAVPTMPVLEKTCDDYFVSDSGSFSSPNYPNQYPNDEYCTWYITVPKGKTIKLYFTDFQLEVSPDCSHDYVSIYDGPSILSDELGLICIGSSHEYTSTSNKMIVNFSSDSNGTGHGFTAFFHSQLADEATEYAADEATECAVDEATESAELQDTAA